MNTRNTTLLAKMGFQDNDLTTPEHDDMFITCMGDENVLKIVYEVVNTQDILQDYCRMRVQWLENSLRFRPFGFMPEVSKYSVKKIHDWDANSSTENLHKTTVRCHSLAWGKDEVMWGKEGCLQWDCPEIQKMIQRMYKRVGHMFYMPREVIPEKPVTSYKDYIIGFVDLFIDVGLENRSRAVTHNVFDSDDNQLIIPDGFSISVEIKPMIRSVGELIRQIQTYRQFRPDDVFVVISKTTAFKEILAQSNILSIDYAKLTSPRPEDRGIPHRESAKT